MNKIPSILDAGILVRNYEFSKISKLDMTSFLSKVFKEKNEKIDENDYCGAFKGLKIRIKLIEFTDWFCISFMRMKKDVYESINLNVGGCSNLIHLVRDNLLHTFDLNIYDIEVHSPDNLKSIIAKGNRNMSPSHIAHYTNEKVFHPLKLRDNIQSQIENINIIEQDDYDFHPAFIQYVICQKENKYGHLLHFFKIRFVLEYDFNVYKEDKEDLLFVPMKLKDATEKVTLNYSKEYLKKIKNIEEIFLVESGEEYSFFIITNNNYIYYTEHPSYGYN